MICKYLKFLHHLFPLVLVHQDMLNYKASEDIATVYTKTAEEKRGKEKSYEEMENKEKGLK